MFLKLNYCWRLVGTGLSFLLFGLGSLFLGFIWFPLVTFLPISNDIKRILIRYSISLCFRFFFRWMHALRLINYKIEGAEKIREDKGCLIVANHPTLIDVVSLISLYPNATCIVKKDLWSNFFLKRIVRTANYIPNDNPETILEMSEKYLSRGDVLIIFPEGTRTVPGKEIILQRGAAHVSIRLKCPIRVIEFDVNPPMLMKNTPWYKIPIKRPNFIVRIKDIINVEKDFLLNEEPVSLVSRRLTRKIKELIA